MVLDAYILPDDILSMNQGATEDNRGYVLFSITSLDGSKVASGEVNVAGELVARTQRTTSSRGTTRPPQRRVHLPGRRRRGLRLRAQGLPVSIAFNYYNRRPAAADRPLVPRSAAGSSISAGRCRHRLRGPLRGLALPGRRHVRGSTTRPPSPTRTRGDQRHHLLL